MRTILLASAFLFVTVSQAAILNLDPTQSQVTLSGNVAGFPLREQATGSLTTTVGGTIDVTVANGGIQVNGAALDPNVNGNWRPGRNGQATSPADFGGLASAIFSDVTGALRDLLVTAVSPARPLQANGQFDASAIVFAFPPNSPSVLDYDSFLTGPGSRPLAGEGTNQTATVGMFVDNNGTQTLTIAIDATFFFTLLANNDSPLRLQGQLVATNGGGTPKPTITAIEIANGQAMITATGTTQATRVETSVNLTNWGAAEAASTGTDASRTFSVPAVGSFGFFRLAQ